MSRTFNCGLGMVAVVAATEADDAVKILADGGETVYRIGRIVARQGDEPQSRLVGTDVAWPA